MAINKKLEGMDGANFYPDARYRMQWKKIPKEDLPKNYQSYWEIWHDGKHVGELFHGKGQNIAIVFGRVTMYSSNALFESMCKHVAGLFIHPRN